MKFWKKTKNNKWERDWWSLEYPENWEAVEHEECDSFIDPDDIGALQISAYRKNENISESDIFGHAVDDIPEANLLQKVEGQDYQGFTASYDEDDIFWKKYFIWKNNITLYITYNCGTKDKSDNMIEEVEKILKTLKIKKA